MGNVFMKVRIRILQIHAAENCNFHCEHCTAGAPSMNKKYYTYNDYSSYIDKLAAYVTTSRFDVMGGEPFLNPNLLDIIKGLKQSAFDAPVNIVTNGYWLRHNISKYENIFKAADSIGITIHPELNMSGNDVRKITSTIEDKYSIKISVAKPSLFYKLKFVDEPVIRKHCKFCPQLTPDGNITKCHIIAFHDRYTASPPDKFTTLSKEGVFNINTGNTASIEKWYKGRGDGLHECCNYCRYMEDKSAIIKHN